MSIPASQQAPRSLPALALSGSKGSGHGSGWSSGRGRAAVEGIGHATDGRQAEGASGGQKDEGLQSQEGETDR